MMKTVKEKLIGMLIDHGMWENEAEEVFKEAVHEIEHTGKITWERPSEEYPQEMYAVMFLTIVPHVLKWIDENRPDAFYRSMFEKYEVNHETKL